MELLTVKEVAQLKGCSDRYIKALALNGSLMSQTTTNNRNRKMYLIPLDALEPRLQSKYYKQKYGEVPEPLRKAKKEILPKPKPLEKFTAEQRKEIELWENILSDWQNFRNEFTGSKAEADAEFVSQYQQKNPDVNISKDILYRKRKALQQNDLDGLVDKRGQWKKGTSSVPDEIKNIFFYVYLDERALPVSKCEEATRLIVQEERPELLPQMPSYDTFYRMTKTFSKPVATLAREGERAYNDRYGIFVDRFYDDMASNDYWIADGHTIDVITLSEDGLEQRHRMTLSAFIDARSGIYVGWVVTENPSSDSTLAALRKAIMRYGLPKYIYVDNGREYLNIDIGGTGHRTKKKKVKIQLPTPILTRLGIQMTNAIPRNAQAKIIEREFRNFTFLSRLFDTYCGSNVVAKPEKLKHKLKAGQIPTDGELIQVVNDMIDGYFNQQPYNGKVVADKGKTKLQVYQERLPKAIRRAATEDLNLMMMRSARLQTVGKNGVYLTICGERLYYFNDELIINFTGKKVFLRYDPENLDEVRIYDEEEKFIMTAPLRTDMQLSYGADKEGVRNAMHEKRRLKRKVQDAADVRRELVVSQYGHINLLDVYVRAAKRSATGLLLPSNADDHIVEMVTTNERREEKVASGGEEIPIVDISRMIRNNEKKGADV
ncbi:MAG TPA: MerR family transcriptional regulator [Ruminococcaceae bacterium]|nr:MerR family transcriptional regulator [Oscillospiraceae bacterium]